MTTEAWRAAAASLPEAHLRATRQPGASPPSLTSLSALRPEVLEPLDGPGRVSVALDVFMVEAFVRRHELPLPAPSAAALASSAALCAEALDIPPILTYGLYIRENPPADGRLRSFTPLESEYRFIRMHRLIEDRMDVLVERLAAVPSSADPPAALEAAMPALRAEFRLINRTLAGFRDPVRMPRDEFFHQFRPYYESVVDPATGAVLLEGPSGLQSPSHRLLAMRLGYRDAPFDLWTERLLRHQLADARQAVRAARADRDAGRSMLALCEAVLGPAPELPHLHPRYGAALPALLAEALAGGFVSAGIEDDYRALGLELGAWPGGAPHPGWPEVAPPPRAPDDAGRRVLGHLRALEAMLFGFQVEHAATAAAQIGHVRGTGGTSGVEFLLLATFRRAFPQLWLGDGETEF